LFLGLATFSSKSSVYRNDAVAELTISRILLTKIRGNSDNAKNRLLPKLAPTRFIEQFTIYTRCSLTIFISYAGWVSAYHSLSTWNPTRLSQCARAIYYCFRYGLSVGIYIVCKTFPIHSRWKLKILSNYNDHTAVVLSCRFFYFRNAFPTNGTFVFCSMNK